MTLGTCINFMHATSSSLHRGCDPDSFLPGLQVSLHCVWRQLYICMETVQGDHTGTLHGHYTFCTCILHLVLGVFAKGYRCIIGTCI